MDPSLAESIEVGSTVYSSDDHKVGTVSKVLAASFHVEKGFFFIKDYEVPLSAVASIDPEEARVILNVTRDVALSSKWEIEDDFEDFVENDEDSPVDGDGDRVLTGAAQTPSLPIIEELDEDDPPLMPLER